MLAITPFYMLFEFFLLKYIFLLITEVNDDYILILTILIGLNHFLPMIFEARKSRKITRFLTTLDGVWMWASVMFFFDILVIYMIGSIAVLPVWINMMLLAIVPVCGVYNYWKAHHLAVNEKTLELKNLSRDINIAQLSDVHFGSVHHKKSYQTSPIN